MQLVNSQGALNWVRISHQLQSRTPKQCRERYHQNLKPSLNHTPITPEEGALIEQLVLQVGKRWAEIARQVHGRSDNAVKNWWNGSQNRRKRVDRRKFSGPSYLGAFEEHPETCYVRPAVAIPQYPLHPHRHHASVGMRPVPPPLSPSYRTAVGSSHHPHGHQYGPETPLPSPQAMSPGASSVDMTPSLMSDGGSCYTTSPSSAGPGSYPCSPVELPPLKNIGQCSPSFADAQHGNKLPTLDCLKQPFYPPEFRSQQRQCSHLPTAPNSPVNLPALRKSASLDIPGLGARDEGGASRESRINVSGLLN